MAHDLRPFRQYSEQDVVNLYAYSGDSTLVKKGLVVKIMGDGFAPDTTSNGYDVNQRLGDVGASYTNVVSQRYGATPKVGIPNSGDRVLGLTLMDIRELDENGEKLIFNPRKAAEMGVIVSGQAVPVLTQGIVMYSGVTVTDANATPHAILGTLGELRAISQAEYSALSTSATLSASTTRVGRWLGKSVNDVAALKIEL
jgi:hypothetical protein